MEKGSKAGVVTPNLTQLLSYCAVSLAHGLSLPTIPPNSTHTSVKYTFWSYTFYKENDQAAPSAQMNNPMTPYNY